MPGKYLVINLSSGAIAEDFADFETAKRFARDLHRLHPGEHYSVKHDGSTLWATCQRDWDGTAAHARVLNTR